jgi:hypothetical protein
VSFEPPIRRSVRTVAPVVAALAASAFLVQTGLGAFGAAAAPAAPLISSAPLRPTISTKATVAFDRVSGLSYECALDDGVFRPCPSRVTFRGLNRALHAFRVRAHKPAGTTSDASTYSWAVVAQHRRLAQTRLRLRPTFATAPVRPWISRNATFAWLLKRSTTGECRLDQGRWKRCVNPRTYLGLCLGEHVFRIRAKAASGRRSSVNRFVWAISTSPPPPAPAITSHPQATTTSTDASFDFDVASGSTAECRLDDRPWQECSPPAMYVGLDPGTHTFCVRAIGPAGVTGPETCFTWNVVGSESPPQPSVLFAISGNVLGLLYPSGRGPLPLTVSNSFDFDLAVTALSVNVLPGSSMPGCDGPTNLQVTQSNTAGGSVSVVVPAHGLVTLPAQGATTPRVTMLDLATNQGACKNAVFTFSYAGQGTRA